MIGNDVVDLECAAIESRWQRRGFLDKLFTLNEQEIISQSENPELTIWNLWSRKEAAYKIYNRTSGISKFMPLKLICIFETDETGTVRCEGKLYHTKTAISERHIETIAVENVIDFDRIQVLKSRDGIQKINGIPSFGSYQAPVSISHHGNFEQIIVLKESQSESRFEF